jgi:hypothetical protein
MKMGGFVGGVEYRGEISGFLPLLMLGEKVHVGKATGFGLGRYSLRLETSASHRNEGVAHGSEHF